MAPNKDDVVARIKAPAEKAFSGWGFFEWSGGKDAFVQDAREAFRAPSEKVTAPSKGSWPTQFDEMINGAYGVNKDGVVKDGLAGGFEDRITQPLAKWVKIWDRGKEEHQADII